MKLDRRSWLSAVGLGALGGEGGQPLVHRRRERAGAAAYSRRGLAVRSAHLRIRRMADRRPRDRRERSGRLTRRFSIGYKTKVLENYRNQTQEVKGKRRPKVRHSRAARPMR